MIELRIKSGRPKLNLTNGSLECPGRNHPEVGRWMIQELIGSRRPAVIADPMVSCGQLWALRPDGIQIIGCELVPERAALARANGIRAVAGTAETWRPEQPPDLVAFSPPYPNADHDSGKTQKQKDFVRSKGLHAMQSLDQVPCLWRVFAQIATYSGSAPVAVIVKNYIRDQVEVDWVSEVAGAMQMAGLGEVSRFFRRIPISPMEAIKRSRNAKHKWIDREQILVARRSAC